jgi:hypothetical protein
VAVWSDESTIHTDEEPASFISLLVVLDWVALNDQMEDGTGRGKVNGNLFGDRDAHPAVET